RNKPKRVEGGGLTFTEFMDELYLSLLRQGYKHHHIDNEMDIWHYLRLNQKYREQDYYNSGNQNLNEMEVPAENII
ncbi:hypothetical protein ABE44_15015, partial [Bacillus thuringiensis]|uniref:hypothetical protein n=1 Tax=Bacillus thuringiensis TaxID=1428 RepID=UPI001A7EB32C